MEVENDRDKGVVDILQVINNNDKIIKKNTMIKLI